MTVSSGCGNSEEATLEKTKEFHIAITTSQEALDEVADDIYTYWYNAIYKDYYSGSIDLAIYYAEQANAENITLIKSNDATIKSLYKEIKDSPLSSEIKAVMSAYSDYYEFVINVSGSFNSYSQNKETLKKELASAIRDLAMEI